MVNRAMVEIQRDEQQRGLNQPGTRRKSSGDGEKIVAEIQRDEQQRGLNQPGVENQVTENVV